MSLDERFFGASDMPQPGSATGDLTTDQWRLLALCVRLQYAHTTDLLSHLCLYDADMREDTAIDLSNHLADLTRLLLRIRPHIIVQHVDPAPPHPVPHPSTVIMGWTSNDVAPPVEFGWTLDETAGPVESDPAESELDDTIGDGYNPMDYK